MQMQGICEMCIGWTCCSTWTLVRYCCASGVICWYTDGKWCNIQSLHW